MLGQEERKYVLQLNQMHHILSSMRTATLLPGFLKGCFSSLHLQGLLEEVAVSWGAQKKVGTSFPLLTPWPATFFQPAVPRSVECKLPSDSRYLCYGCTSCLLQSREPLVDQTSLAVGSRAFAVREDCQAMYTGRNFQSDIQILLKVDRS